MIDMNMCRVQVIWPIVIYKIVMLKGKCPIYLLLGEAREKVRTLSLLMEHRELHEGSQLIT